ncbi:MAG TPA: patatin-like phospholipase family protein [Pseudonocardia sp.]|nr:patatin-like phospholipase family protein [Pseudonocardia sp.]
MRPPRTGLVLGAGGILGSAWMTGVLPGLEARLDRPLGELEFVMGTSAGSVLAAALRCGMTVDELVSHHFGEPVHAAEVPGTDPAVLPDMRRLERETGDGLPPLPYPRLGSPRLLASAVVRPWRVSPIVAATGFLPVGRARIDSLVHLLDGLQARIGVTPERWVPGPPLWVVAVDYDTGRRVVFGRAGGPRAPVADAVLASCAIPGWIAPQVIDGRRYVDGGVSSSTSVSLLARHRAPALDEAIVLAPMASHRYDRPADPVARVERRVRRVMTLWLDREVRRLRARGTRVTVLTPGPDDLAAMGGNLMNPRRRSMVLQRSLETSSGALVRAWQEAA